MHDLALSLVSPFRPSLFRAPSCSTPLPPDQRRPFWKNATTVHPYSAAADWTWRLLSENQAVGSKGANGKGLSLHCRFDMLPPLWFRVTLLWSVVVLTSAIRRKSPYSSFPSFPPPTRPQSSFAFPLGSAASRNTESFVEVPKLDGPGADFTGHNPFDYGSSLNFGGPLSTGVTKLKVVNYEAHITSDDPKKTRYGKPVVKAYESVYETKMKKNGQRYTNTKKRPLPAAQETRNEIEGALDDLQDQMQKDTKQSFGDQPDFDFVLKPETTPEAVESPFPEAGDAGGFFF